MNRARIILGFVAGAMLIASSLMHSLLGWPVIREKLESAQAPADLIASLALGWHWGGAAMFGLGCVVVYLFAQYKNDRAASRRPALLIAILYIAFGSWAIATSRDPFFLIFLIPGLLLAFAASAREATQSGQAT